METDWTIEDKGTYIHAFDPTNYYHIFGSMDFVEEIRQKLIKEIQDADNLKIS